ncbi:unnamed protein product [Phytomonas sp. EM1]|nr:unnamed protein product [Phytomonas sp. EM1]|eukprot:CCW61945.1 unnamed protein product [Phytomonas sp. isolate EM1]
MLYDDIFSALSKDKKKRSSRKSRSKKQSIYRVCHGNGRFWCPEPYNLKDWAFVRRRRVSFSSNVQVILFDKDS